MTNVTVRDIPAKIFNVAKQDYGQRNIILGEDAGLLDSITNNHPVAWGLYKRLRKLDWDELEFDFSVCNAEFKSADKSIYDMMLKTLAWQWEADSIASRSIVNILSNVVTDSRIWTGYCRINENECVHALTYSEIVRGSFDDPQEVKAEILAVEEAHARMATVGKVMGEAHRVSHSYALGLVKNDQETYNAMFMFLVALYFLERIQFMASFAVTFAIVKTGMFQQIGHAVKKIAQDEFEIHAQFGQEVLKAELQTERGLTAYRQCRPLIIQLLWDIVRSETEWSNYLFSEGRELTGVTRKSLTNWVLFNAQAAATFLEVQDDVIVEHSNEFLDMTGFELAWPKGNPLPYMTDYLDISGTQASPQEEKKGDYMVNLVSRRDEQAVFAFDIPGFDMALLSE
mgnify:CR=1 FL=1